MGKIMVLATMMLAASPAMADDLLVGFDDDGPYVETDGLTVSATGGVVFDDFGDDFGGGFPFGDGSDDGMDD